MAPTARLAWPTERPAEAAEKFRHPTAEMPPMAKVSSGQAEGGGEEGGVGEEAQEGAAVGVWLDVIAGAAHRLAAQPP
jgi:hypothetical protein